MDLRSKIREVQDFPTPGVGFKDITPALADPETLKEVIARLSAWAREKQPDLILGAEARGFILGAAIAAAADCGFVTCTYFPWLLKTAAWRKRQRR